ncbi:HNH endonuclease [uncultured Microbacterium sp.]|uniref:HNH endonuclease signature motif containing protein n=1 Tax=uncultured Microbacterium sp. TaxID=191216 RepID=UPI0035CB0E51
MTFLAELDTRVATLSSRAELDVEAERLLDSLRGMDDADVVATAAAASDLLHWGERLLTVTAAVITERSARERGSEGMAAVRGHRTPASLVQSISGGTRADATRAVRLGESLIAGESASVPELEAEAAAAPKRPWDDVLRRAMLEGTLAPALLEAIMRGLGLPPECDDAESTAAAHAVWALAAEQLVAEASDLPVEELARRARQVRDALDPAGVEDRFAARYAQRAFRMWVDADGRHHARIAFDDEGHAWAQSMIDAALRPRRGGPRFVDSAERQAADELSADPRTNDQLTYDLVMDVWRAGMLAQAPDVFGARQPGVRMIVVAGAIGPRDAFGRLLATAHLEDGGDALPGSVLERSLCSIGYVEVTVDSCGNPLDVGREQRLYTPKQRVAMAARDGGCVWTGCCVPASYCEAHHLDQWWRDKGRTDIDRGVLLCRFHHMLLHNTGARITREGLGPFVLHQPGGAPPVELKSRSAVKWAWDPPPQSSRAGWRAA